MKDKEVFDLDYLLESDLPAPQAKPAPVVPQQPVVTWTTGQLPVNPLPVQPITVNWTESSKSETPKPNRPWFAFVASVLGFALLGFAIGYSVAHVTNGGDTVEPDTDPVTGAYVAIFYQDADIQEYSSSQREFLNSVNTANWLEEHHANWKKIDVDDKVDRLEKPFQVMAEKHRAKEPWIVIAAGKKFASEPIESNEQAMKLLQKWVK